MVSSEMLRRVETEAMRPYDTSAVSSYNSQTALLRAIVKNMKRC
jgi:hypothetical protein